MSRLIIDAYNLVHAPAFRPYMRADLEHTRRHLADMVLAVGPHLAEHTTLVFDGAGTTRDTDRSHPAITIVYSPRHETADTVVGRLVERRQRGDHVIVVSSDRVVVDSALAAGAEFMSCRRFVEEYEQRRRDVSRDVQRAARRRVPGSTFGDHFPEELG
jgi:predicted RNA-binding protein with PIN domain